MQPTRRTVLATFLSASALPFLAAALAGAQSPPARLLPTPACDDGDATPPSSGRALSSSPTPR